MRVTAYFVAHLSAQAPRTIVRVGISSAPVVATLNLREPQIVLLTAEGGTFDLAKRKLLQELQGDPWAWVKDI